jgi:hypothetical protein
MQQSGEVKTGRAAFTDSNLDVIHRGTIQDRIQASLAQDLEKTTHKRACGNSELPPWTYRTIRMEERKTQTGCGVDSPTF